MTPTELLQAMYDSRLGVGLAESIYIYPLVEATHLLSLAFSFGLIFLIDLRLIGWTLRNVIVTDLLCQLRPWVIGGFAVTFVTGILLTFATGPVLLASPVFPLKLLFMLLAVLNAVIFEIKFGRRVADWGGQRINPRGARTAGFTSLISWTAVVICGRLIPYFDGGF
jgi:hypothetical protein